jgi:hypothetical protein
LGNAHRVQFEDAYTCQHSGIKNGGCSICGKNNNFNFGFPFGNSSHYWNGNWGTGWNKVWGKGWGKVWGKGWGKGW